MDPNPKGAAVQDWQEGRGGAHDASQQEGEEVEQRGKNAEG